MQAVFRKETSRNLSVISLSRLRRGSLDGVGVKGWRHVGGAREVSRGD